jgi:hypothetical protein
MSEYNYSNISSDIIENKNFYVDDPDWLSKHCVLVVLKKYVFLDVVPLFQLIISAP